MSNRAARKGLWRCPACGRGFRTPKQWHSCHAASVASHFTGKPPWLCDCFDCLVKRVGLHGPMRVDAVKTSINLIGRAHFGAVQVRKAGLTVGILLARRLEHPRIFRHEEAGGRWVAHRVRINRPEDLDDEVLGWLAEALALKS